MRGVPANVWENSLKLLREQLSMTLCAHTHPSLWLVLWLQGVFVLTPLGVIFPKIRPRKWKVGKSPHLLAKQTFHDHLPLKFWLRAQQVPEGHGLHQNWCGRLGQTPLQLLMFRADICHVLGCGELQVD
jgi:hypothetical protein